jgi:uracil-DNA glycosylase
LKDNGFLMDKKEQLDDLKGKALEDDTLPLKSGATNLVFGVGNPEAEILCVGEGPGYWEDQKAEPFVGNAGMLLNRLLASINIKREEVYITNVVMHRPPENRDPLPEEIKAYQVYVDGIIEIIKPKVILTLGRFSMAKFMPGVFISSVHGKSREIIWKGRKITIVPMYHPAAALRNGQVMQSIKNDFLDLVPILAKLKEEKDDRIEEEKEVEEIKQTSLF